MGHIAIRVTPRSSKPGIGGWREGSDRRQELEVRVAELPAEEAANSAVVKLLAKALGVANADVQIVSGDEPAHVDVPLELEQVRRRPA